MRVSRRRGGLRLRLDPPEVVLLGSLLEDFVARLRNGVAGDPVERRLFPAAYADDEAAAEFRGLTEPGLRDERGRRALTCRAELTGAGPTGAEVAGEELTGEELTGRELTGRELTGRELTLTAEDGERWSQVLNDLRLVIGTRLGVTEQDDHEIRPDDPQATARSVYGWLTYLQELLIQALMR